MSLYSLPSGTVIPRLRDIDLSELSETTRRRLNKALWDLEFKEQALERPLGQMAVRLTLEYVEWLITVAKIEELQFSERLALEFLLYEFEGYMWMMRSKRGKGPRLTRQTVLLAWAAEKELFRGLGKVELGSRWDSQVASIQLALLDVKGWKDETVRIFFIVMRKMLCLKGCRLVTGDDTFETREGDFDIREPLHLSDPDVDMLDVASRPAPEEGVLNRGGDVDFGVGVDEELKKSSQVEMTPPVNASIPIPSSMSPLLSSQKLYKTDQKSAGVSKELNNKGVMQKSFSMAPKFPNLTPMDQKRSGSEDSTISNEHTKSGKRLTEKRESQNKAVLPEKRALEDKVDQKIKTELNVKGPPLIKRNLLLQNQNASDRSIPQEGNATVEANVSTKEARMDNGKFTKETFKSVNNTQGGTLLNNSSLHKGQAISKEKAPIHKDFRETPVLKQRTGEAILEVQQTQSPSNAPQPSHELSEFPPSINISSSQSPTVSQIHQLTQSSQSQVSTITNDIQSGQRDVQTQQAVLDVSSDFTNSSDQQRASQNIESYKLLKKELAEMKTSLAHVTGDFSVFRGRSSEIHDLIKKHAKTIEQLSKGEHGHDRDVFSLLDIVDLRFKTIVDDIKRLKHVISLWGTLDNDLATFRAEVCSKHSALDTAMSTNSSATTVLSRNLETLQSSLSGVLLDLPKITGTLDEVVSKVDTFQSFKNSLESGEDLNTRLSKTENSMKALSFNMDSLLFKTKDLQDLNAKVQSLNMKLTQMSQSFSALNGLKKEVHQNNCNLTQMGEVIKNLSSLNNDIQSNSHDALRRVLVLENKVTDIGNVRDSALPDLQRRLDMLERKVGASSELTTSVSHSEESSTSMMNRDEINKKLAASSEKIRANIPSDVKTDTQSHLNRNEDMTNLSTHSIALLNSPLNDTVRLGNPTLSEASNSGITAMVPHEPSSATTHEGEPITTIQKSSKGDSGSLSMHEELSVMNSRLTRTIDDLSSKTYKSISEMQSNVIKLGTAFLDLTKDQKDKASVINLALEKNDRSIENLRRDVESYNSGNHLQKIIDRIEKLETMVVSQQPSGNSAWQDENEQLKKTITSLERKLDQQDKRFQERLSLHIGNTNEIIYTMRSEIKSLQQRVMSSENDFTLSPPLGTSTQSQSTQKSSTSIVHSHHGIGEDTQNSPKRANNSKTQHAPGNFTKSKLVGLSQTNESKISMSPISLVASLLNKVRSDPKSGLPNREEGSIKRAASEKLDLSSVDIKKLKLIRKSIDSDD